MGSGGWAFPTCLQHQCPCPHGLDELVSSSAHIWNLHDNDWMVVLFLRLLSVGAGMEVRPLRGLDKGNPMKTHPQSQAALKCLAPQSIAEPRVKAAVRGKKLSP